MKEWRFIIEFYHELGITLPSWNDPSFQGKKMAISKKAGEFALRKYLDGPDSPLRRYSFNCNYCINNTTGLLEDDINRLSTIVDNINSLICDEDKVVIHIWGHANERLVGCTYYDCLFEILHGINCAHLYVNLMNSCRTFGAKLYAGSDTTIWYSTREVNDSSSFGFEPALDNPEDHTLPDDWDHDFDIPFLIYDCWDDEHSKFDFATYLSKVSEKGGNVDLYGTTD